ncbi:dienelactone hydrolase family protein [uncultured Nostoc sp.]|uniref:dienelactone hydrolase family protein n=1 Tax=uncultured Nostoc sp. TaxID=340711 RepID=UPI002636FA88|nr:dienelactone hydrolase family protein [uncultured Nostoc sp.]
MFREGEIVAESNTTGIFVSVFPLVTIYRYEGVSHGFNRVGSSAYRKEAAELARARTLAFLKQHLGSGAKV